MEERRKQTALFLEELLRQQQQVYIRFGVSYYYYYDRIAPCVEDPALFNIDFEILSCYVGGIELMSFRFQPKTIPKSILKCAGFPLMRHNTVGYNVCTHSAAPQAAPPRAPPTASCQGPAPVYGSRRC
jgi:hypothetical protein